MKHKFSPQYTYRIASIISLVFLLSCQEKTIITPEKLFGIKAEGSSGITYPGVSITNFFPDTAKIESLITLTGTNFDDILMLKLGNNII